MTPACPYCFGPSERVTGKRIYPHRRDLHHKTFYLCEPCGAWVGCHPGGDKALGRLANAELRAAKQRVHAAFDPMWQGGHMGRSQAYTWLAERLGIPKTDCHIGMFTLEQCSAAVIFIESRDQLPMPPLRAGTV